MSDHVLVIKVGDEVHEANFDAIFSMDHSDLMEYIKYLSATYAAWAEIKEKAQEVYEHAKNALDLLRARKRLNLDEWYAERGMKPVGASLEARITADNEVQKAIEALETARHNYEQAKVVTQTMWFQRSLMTRETEA